MHRDRKHDHHGGSDSTDADRRNWARAGPGHNRTSLPLPPSQWQAPHLEKQSEIHQDASEPDIDLVEAAFADGFVLTTDPTSFLRLARIPFKAILDDGRVLELLRVEIDMATDVGCLMPHVGGGSFRYDPLPASMTTRRRRLRFVYFDGKELQGFDLAKVRELPEFV
jgi:hypothetical protein